MHPPLSLVGLRFFRIFRPSGATATTSSHGRRRRRVACRGEPTSAAPASFSSWASLMRLTLTITSSMTLRRVRTPTVTAPHSGDTTSSCGASRSLTGGRSSFTLGALAHRILCMKQTARDLSSEATRLRRGIEGS